MQQEILKKLFSNELIIAQPLLPIIVEVTHKVLDLPASQRKPNVKVPIKPAIELDRKKYPAVSCVTENCSLRWGDIVTLVCPRVEPAQTIGTLRHKTPHDVRNCLTLVATAIWRNHRWLALARFTF